MGGGRLASSAELPPLGGFGGGRFCFGATGVTPAAASGEPAMAFPMAFGAGGGVTPAAARAFPVAGLVMGLGRGRFVEEGPPLSRRLTASVRALHPGDALAR